MSTTPIVLTIAGFDPSSGAGITADIKTLAAHGCYGVACITALTVQSTQGVERVEPVAPDVVRDTLACLASDFSFAAVSIGMLGNAAVAEAVSDFLVEFKPPNVVLDPILYASSGAQLLDDGGLNVLCSRLLPLAEVIAPNVPEAAALTGLAVTDLSSMKLAARRLHELGARNVVVTGGHLSEPTDLLSMSRNGRDPQQVEFASRRVTSKSTHGTGCAFASALAGNLGLGVSLEQAVRRSQNYVRDAIAHAQPVGKGAGPLNHLFRFQQEPRKA
jgi:hydroxymethylpyrimidine kinase/phosphomethylpyrimidine kinase